MAAGDVVQFKPFGSQLVPPTPNIDGTVTLDTAPTFGNTLLLYGANRDGAAAAASAGWTNISAGTVSNGPDGARVCTRPVVLGEGADIQIWPGATGLGVGIIVEIEGTVIEVDSDKATGSTQAIGFPAVTPTSGAPTIIVGAAVCRRGEATHPIFTPGAGWTELLDLSVGGHPQNVVVVKTVAAASGSYTPDAQDSVGATDWGAFSVALSGSAAPPVPGIEVDVYDPDGVHLATITDAFAKSIRVEMDGTGQGTFSINRYSAQATAANLAQGNLVRVSYPAISDEPIFAWFLETGDFDLVSTDEEGGEDLVFAGRGALSYLARAIMWDRSYLESLNHVYLIGSHWVYTKSGSALVSRTSVNFATATIYSAGAAETLDWTGHPTYDDRTYVPITEGPHNGKYVSTKWLATPYVGDGSWRLFASGTGSKPGQILRRVIAETQAVDRPQHPLAAMTVDFDYTDDSDSNAWADGDGATDEFTAQVGEEVLNVVQRLIDTGAIDVVMDPDLVLHAYNEYGRDLSSATFAADKVRFERGVNVADVLRRSVGLELPATHALIDGDDSVTATAERPLFATPVVERYISLEGTDPTVLEATGEAMLLDELSKLEGAAFPIAVGDDPENGRYLPGPPGTNGHFWVGDTVTVDTGASSLDYADQDARVMALTISEDDAANILCIVELVATIGAFPWWKNRLNGRGGTGGRIIVKGTPRTEVSGASEGTTIDPDDIDLSGYATSTDLTDHTGDTTDAHDASAISIADAGAYFTGTDVEAALQELGASGGGGGSGTLTTVEEVDGSPTDSAVTKLVFPNGTLAIASHVATYTPAGGGGGATINDGPLKPGTVTDDFDAALSGWSAHSTGGTFVIGDAYAQAVDGSHVRLGFQNQNGQIYKSTSNADLVWQVGGLRAEAGSFGSGDADMFGAAVLDSSGNGVGIVFYSDGNAILADIASWGYNTFYSLISNYGHGEASSQTDRAIYTVRITRVTNTWSGSISIDGANWINFGATGSKTITVDRRAIGIFYNPSNTYRGTLVAAYEDLS